jgi:hypothetical protein
MRGAASPPADRLTSRASFQTDYGLYMVPREATMTTEHVKSVVDYIVTPAGATIISAKNMATEPKKKAKAAPPEAAADNESAARLPARCWKNDPPFRM